MRETANKVKIIDLTGSSKKTNESKSCSKKRKAGSRWTIEEDLKLLEAIEIVGTASNWTRISSIVGSKNADQCNQHWFRVLQAAVVSTPWTEEENRKLVGIKDKCNWKSVAAEIGGGRTEAQCKFQFRLLEKDDCTDPSSKKRKQTGLDSESETEEIEKTVVTKKTKKINLTISSTGTAPKAILFMEDDDDLISVADTNLNTSLSSDSDSIATFDAFDHDSMISVLSPEFSPTLTDDFLLTPSNSGEDEINERFESFTPFVPPFQDL